MDKTKHKNLTLTKNEQLILDLLQQNCDEIKITKKLGISLHTLKSHKNKFMLLGLL